MDGDAGAFAVTGDGYFEVLGLSEGPESCRGSMAEDGARTSGHDGGCPATLMRQSSVPYGINTAMHAVKAA